MTNERPYLLLPLLSSSVLAAASGNGAAAASVLLNRPPQGPSVGLVGLFIFLACMAVVAFAWLRLRRNKPER